MERKIPRIVLAGTGSGCGKTTVVCALLQALADRGRKTGAFKCGPDYIDPMFHSRIIGAAASNLDLYFFDDNTVRYLLAENAADRDISIIEGVMGYYDGMSLDSAKTSTYEVSQVTDSPVVLVVNSRGAALSVLAVIHGFMTFMPDSHIAGVILNQCSEMTYKGLAKEIERRFEGRVKPLGFMPKVEGASLESRHLGLVTAAEVEDLREKMWMLAAQAEKYIDIDGIEALADSAPPVLCDEIVIPEHAEKVRIAVARDRAFCFYYEDSLDVLRRMGAELVDFSPMEDERLPEGIHGLYLGGGYPELYTQELSANVSMRESVRAALQAGLPCIAECGGYMYLGESIADVPMVGYLPGDSHNTGRLTRFGYIHLTAKHDNMLCREGETIAGHEFHYWDSDDTGSGFTAAKATGRSWECAFSTDRLYAGYPHFHFYANLQFAENFYQTCIKEKTGA